MQTPHPFSPAANISGAALATKMLLWMHRQSGDAEVLVTGIRTGTAKKFTEFCSRVCAGKEPKLMEPGACVHCIGGVDRMGAGGAAWVSGICKSAATVT